MKVLRITAEGLPLFKQPLELNFFAQQRVAEEDKASLCELNKDKNVYLQAANAFIGINASGKTSVLKVIELALHILKNDPVNHVEARSILGNAQNAVFKIFFLDTKDNICCLETTIASVKKSSAIRYSITEEKLWSKSLRGVKAKKYLTDFEGMQPVAIRDQQEEFLSDDVSFIIAYNKKANENIDLYSLLSYTNVNVLPVTNDIPMEVITFLDPTVEQLYFEEESGKHVIHLKFFGQEEILLNQSRELEQYLSSGTIKGIITFSIVRDVLQTGGYLLIDEIENHFNKEIVTTLMRFFMDSKLNKNGGILIFTTHYPELLDEYDRNDGIYIVRNRIGITVENLSKILKRNDIKKSDAYQSGFLEGTTPAYEAYIKLKKSLSISIE